MNDTHIGFGSVFGAGRCGVKPVIYLSIAYGMLMAPSAVLAENIAAESLEWIVSDSDLIVRGTISKVVTEKGEYQLVWERVTVAVKETLKGKHQERLEFIFRNVAMDHSPSNWMDEEAEILLFLVSSKRYIKDDPGYMRSPLAIRLYGAQPHAVRLDGKAREPVYSRMFTTDFKVLSEPDEILKAVRTAAKSPKVLKSRRIEVPSGTEAHTALYGGSGVFLEVPSKMPTDDNSTSDNEMLKPGTLASLIVSALLATSTVALCYRRRRTRRAVNGTDVS